jgi:hypothetical protein
MSCQKHTESDLIEVLSSNLGFDEYAVARWCPNCGAIVVDSDFDNRTSPGKYMKMRKPRNALDKTPPACDTGGST